MLTVSFRRRSFRRFFVCWLPSVPARFRSRLSGIAVSSPGVGASERVLREPTSRGPFICLLRGSSLARQTVSVIAISVVRASLLTRPIYQIPVFLFVPLSPPLACPALTRVTRSVLFPAPCGTSRLCFFGSFQKKSPAPNTTRRGFGPFRARFLPAPSQKAPLALGSRAPRVALRRGVPSEIRANQDSEDNKNGTL